MWPGLPIIMLYTRKGDSGTTKDLKSKPGERKSKSSCQTESLGALDELNSFLGLVKVKAAGVEWVVSNKKPAEIVLWVQNGLFSIQAEVAGADKRVGQEKVTEMEGWIDAMEKEMPPIKTFFISGGTELGALFDISRTLARKAERRAIAAVEQKEVVLDTATLAFLNRLSSLLYAFARLTNHKSGIKEQPPTYS
jgi:cob(I)alamin adenosyltransferase